MLAVCEFLLLCEGNTFQNMFWCSDCLQILLDFCFCTIRHLKTCFGFQVATEEYQTLYIMNYVRHSENIFLCSGCEGRLPDRARAEVRKCKRRTVQERPKTGDEGKIGNHSQFRKS